MKSITLRLLSLLVMAIAGCSSDPPRSDSAAAYENRTVVRKPIITEHRVLRDDNAVRVYPYQALPDVSAAPIETQETIRPQAQAVISPQPRQVNDYSPQEIIRPQSPESIDYPPPEERIRHQSREVNDYPPQEVIRPQSQENIDYPPPEERIRHQPREVNDYPSQEVIRPQSQENIDYPPPEERIRHQPREVNDYPSQEIIRPQSPENIDYPPPEERIRHQPREVNDYPSQEIIRPRPQEATAYPSHAERIRQQPHDYPSQERIRRQPLREVAGSQPQEATKHQLREETRSHPQVLPTMSTPTSTYTQETDNPPVRYALPKIRTPSETGDLSKPSAFRTTPLSRHDSQRHESINDDTATNNNSSEPISNVASHDSPKPTNNDESRRRAEANREREVQREVQREVHRREADTTAVPDIPKKHEPSLPKPIAEKDLTSTNTGKLNNAPDNNQTNKQSVVALLSSPPVAIPTDTGGRSTPVRALIQQSEAQRAAGDLVRAAATLERGVRIEPRNPYLWNRLARIRLEQGLFGQAHNMAAKSNTLAGGSTTLSQENQRIISEAGKRSGN